MAEASAPRSDARIPELDGLRGIAIALVLLWHYFALQVRTHEPSVLGFCLVLLRPTWSGVDLFFVLSGFLIGGILLDARGSRTYYATFYRRRVLRILPLYGVVCGLFAAGGIVLGEGWRGEGGHFLFGGGLPWYVFPLFIQNAFMASRGSFRPLPLGLTWSLAIEEQFYATLPLLVRWLSPRALVRALVAVVAGAPLLRTFAFYRLPHGAFVANVLTPMRADTLAMGVLAAIVVRSPRGRAALARRCGSLKVAVVALACGALALTLFGHPDASWAVTATAGYSAFALFYTLVLLLAVSSPAGALGALLRVRWLRMLGEVAYGTYMLHVGILGICFALVFGRRPSISSGAELAVALFALAATIAIARLSWNYFEGPLVRIGRRARYAVGERGE